MALMKRERQESERTRVIQPLISVREEEGDVILDAEMSGLRKEDISIDLNGDEMTIRGRAGRPQEPAPKGYAVVYKERCPLEYARTFVIGEDVDKSKIDARYENGILSVRMGRLEKAQPKKIEIKG